MFKLKKVSHAGQAILKSGLGLAGGIITSVLPFAAPYVKAQDIIPPPNDDGGLKDKLGNIDIPLPDPGQKSSREVILDISTKVITIILFIAGILAIVYLIFSGIIYVTAGGDTGKADKGRTGVINAVIGLIIIGAALILVRFATGLLRDTEEFNDVPTPAF